MNRKERILGIMLLIFLSINSLSGQKVSRHFVQQSAENFILEYFPGQRTIDQIRKVSFNHTDSLIYLIDLKPEGWILFSADQRAEPVIGFSPDGTFKVSVEDKLNPAYNWLHGIQDQLKELKEREGVPNDREWDNLFEGKSINKKSTAGITVENLIPVTWDQSKYFNQFCPEDENAYGGYTPVGCVAVSMAQAMSAFKFPETGVGSYNYFHDEYGTQYANFEQTHYLWDSMSPDQGDEFNALLLYHCAVSVDMDFGPDGSGSQTFKAANSLKKYFNYSGEVRSRKKVADEEQWKAIINEELINGRPVIYSGDGNDDQAGHAFNVDGVMNGKYYHLNWGWGGNNNGFYNLNDLTPGSHNFNYDQAVITGIQPLYYPSGLILEDSIIGFNLPSGTAVGKLSVIDEATDNVYEKYFLSDSTFIEGQWVKDFYLDQDTVRINRSFDPSDEGVKKIYVSVTDKYGHNVEKSINIHISETYVSNTGTGLWENLDDYLVYPNPVNQTLYIKGGEANGPSSGLVRIRIYSVLGNLIIHEAGHQVSEGIAVDNLNSGVYFLEISPEPGKVQMIKFLKR